MWCEKKKGKNLRISYNGNEGSSSITSYLRTSTHTEIVLAMCKIPDLLKSIGISEIETVSSSRIMQIGT